jgi:hypothetical protein
MVVKVETPWKPHISYEPNFFIILGTASQYECTRTKIKITVSVPTSTTVLAECMWVGWRLKLILHSDHFLILGVSGSPKLDCEHGSVWKLNTWRTNYHYSAYNARNVQATSHLRQESRNPHMGNFICWKHDIEAY